MKGIQKSKLDRTSDATPKDKRLGARLVRIGVNLIEEIGVAQLSLREVAKRAQVSHMAPYSHFRNKTDLLCSIASAGFMMLRDHLQASVDARAMTPDDAFVAVGLAYIDFARKYPQLLTLMFGGVILPEQLTSELAENRGKAFSDLVCLVQAAMDIGKFKKADPYAVAFAGWSIAHGYAQLELGGELSEKLSQHPPRDALTILSMLVEGLRP